MKGYNVALDPRQIQVDRPISILEEQAAERLYEEERDKVTFGQAVSAAFSEENTMAYVFNGLESHFPDDENFRLTPELITKYTEGIPEDKHDYLVDAVSLPHLEKLYDRAKESVKNQDTIAKYGWGGVALQVAAATADVPAIAATVLTEGYAAPYIWGNKISRLSRVFRNATASSVSAAAIESYLVSQNKMKDPYDILYAAGGGFLLGGAVSAGASIFGKASRDRYRKAALNTMKYAEESQAADVNQAMIDRGIDTGVGAAENPGSRSVQEMDIRRGNQLKIDDAESEPFAAFGIARIDVVGQLKRSVLGLTRRVANILGEDAVEPGEITADLIKTVGTKTTANKFYVTYDKSYNEWAKSSGIGAVGRTAEVRRGEFGKLVADEIESPGTTTDPNVIEAARNTSIIFNDMLKDAKRANVKGYDVIPDDLTYFTHLWDGHRLLKADREYGPKIVKKLLSKSLMSANRTMDQDIADSIANGMYNKIIKSEVGMDAGMARAFSSSNKETLRDILLEEELLPLEQVDRLLSQLDFDREGLPSRARSRLKFDMSASEEFNGKTLHIKELMERDTEAVVNSYINTMQGRIALAKKGIYSDGDFESIKKDIQEEGKKLGADGIKQAEKDIERLDVLYALISGRTSPLMRNPSSDGQRLIRLLMDYNFIRVMNQVGFAQIAELGNAVSIDGVTGLLRVMPDLRGMVKRAKNGQLEDSVARDIEAFVGVGVDRNIQQSLNRYSVEDMYGVGKGDRIDRAIGVMDKLKRATADISGLAGLTAIFERFAAKIATQTFVDVAYDIPKGRFKKLNFGKTTLEQDTAARLRSFGLDEKIWPRVVQQIKKHSTLRPSMFSQKRTRRDINMDAWDDIDAREALSYGIARWCRQSIQQNDVGNLNIHMTSTMGKIFTQFRAFMLVSHAKQFLHNIKRNDFAAYQSFMMSSFFGMMSYIAQTHVNSLGRADKKQFLEERLTAEELGKNAFARSSWAALFPSVIDYMAFAIGEDPVFQYKRTTGLATGFFSGAPIINQLDTVGKVVSGGGRALLNPDYQWSRSQQRALNSLLPFQNAIGIKNILNQMVEGLPETARIE